MSEHVVIFATDENYWEVLYVALFSLCENNRDLNLKVFILSNGSNGEFNRRSTVLMQTYKNVHIANIIVDHPARFEGLPTPFHFTKGCYYRLSIGRELLEITQTVLYLDCDIIVRKSILELLSTPLGDKIIAAAPDPPSANNWDRLGMPRGSHYFNSGVLLVDLERWRTEDLEAQVCSYLKDNAERILWADQDALNAILHHRCLPLNPIYNFGEGYSKLQRQGRITIDPAIAHFNGSI